MKTQTRYLTLSHAARLLGCSAAWVSVLFDRGLLPGVRDSGGRRLLEGGGVEAFRRNQRQRRRRERPGTASGDAEASLKFDG